jgi:predicted permease
MLNDLRYAIRMLRHNPGFSLIAVGSLALGIGANAAIFSFADFILLRPLPVANASEVMVVQSQFRGESLVGLTSYSPVSYPDFDDLRKRSTSFAGLAASQYAQFGFAPDKTALPQMKFGALVTGNFFDVLGVRPALGRGFRDDEDKVVGRDAVVVLGHQLWATEFALSPDVIGKNIFLNGLPFTVIGVAPESFTGPSPYLRADLFVPLAMQATLAGDFQHSELEMRGLRVMAVQGRLKPGVGTARAAADARLISQQLAQAYPKTNNTCSLVVASYAAAQIRSLPVVTMMVLVMSGLAAVVLLIACANVMNLMLSRAAARSREIAVRLAMGAGRLRLVRQLLTESLLIAILGGVLGLMIAQAGADLFSRFRIPVDVPIVVDVKLDPQVLLFALVVSMASAILFGLAPALQSTKPDLVPALKTSGPAPTRHRRFLGRNTLVIVQMAGSLLLLVFATQAYRGARRFLLSSAGFRTNHLLMASFNPTLARNTMPKTQEFYRKLLEQARALAGVKSVALAQAMPMVPTSPVIRVVPEGVQLAPGTEAVSVLSNIVSEGYFETVGVSLVEGRAFESTDRAHSPAVTIVNEVFARKYYPNQDPVGARLRLNSKDGPFVQIVGVAKTSKYVFPVEPPTEYIYLPLAQNPADGMTLLLETKGPSAEAAGPLRDLVRRLDSRQPMYGVRSMEEFYDVRATQTMNILVGAVGGLAALGLVLALVGLYGLMTYSVSLRQREIGIRMAIGGERPALFAWCSGRDWH